MLMPFAWHCCLKLVYNGHVVYTLILLLLRLQVCPKDYTKALLQWVDPENLPEYLGGTSKATLLDDAGPWQDPAIIAKVGIGVPAAVPCQCLGLHVSIMLGCNLHAIRKHT